MRTTILSLLALAGAAACSSSTASTTSAGTGGTTSTGTGGTTSTSTHNPLSITAPDDAWTWVPFDNAFCGNGSTVGIGVNLSTTSTRVLLYLEGGGACWNELTCFT